jgi:hypothetical protein
MTDPKSDGVSWTPIDSQAELESLDDHGFWEDAETVAFVGSTVSDHALFPRDVSRSGHLNWNIRILLQVGHLEGSHLEILLVDCDEFSSSLFRGFSLRGRVDFLKRVEVDGHEGRRLLRCSRVMYRFLSVDQGIARTFYGFEAAGQEHD